MRAKSTQDVRAGTRGDLEYLRILHLAASTMEADVAIALTVLLIDSKAITAEAVKGAALVVDHRATTTATIDLTSGNPSVALSMQHASTCVGAS